jgi:hypothetical protein
MCFTKKQKKLKNNKIHPLNYKKCALKDINQKKKLKIKKEYIPPSQLQNSQ